jgi:hypothetical protein
VGVDWIYVVQDTDQMWALLNAVMKLRVPDKAKQFLTSLGSINSSRKIFMKLVVTKIMATQIQVTVRGLKRIKSRVCVKTDGVWNNCIY